MKSIKGRFKLSRLSVVVVLLFVSNVAKAYDFAEGSLCYNIVSSEDLTCEVTYKYDDWINNGYNYGKGDITISETVTRSNGDTYTVIGIGDRAFIGCLYMTRISLPQTITYIGSDSFEQCTGLSKITIPDNVETIGGAAFAKCNQITEITIPNSVISIGGSAFGECTGLKNVMIGEGVTSIGARAFVDCDLNTLYLYGRLDSYYEVFDGMTCVLLYAHLDQVDAIEEYYSGTVIPLEQVYPLTVEEVYPRSIVFDLVIIEGITIKNLQIDGQEIMIEGNGSYIIKDLLPNTTYTYTLTFMYGDEERTQKGEVTTKDFYSEATIENIMVSSVSVAITLNDDAYCALPDEYGLIYGDTYYATDVSGVAKVTGLQKETKYTFELYAKYGEMEVKGESITTTTPQVIKPSVTTLEATDVSYTSATLNAIVVLGTEEIIEQGFIYGLYWILEPDDEGFYYPTGMGEDMSVVITGLKQGREYIYCAYAYTASGYVYGDTFHFTTADDPKVETKAATSVTNNSATLNGKITEGTGDILEKGFEYWTAEDDVRIVVVEGEDFNTTLTELTQSTTYNFRAYIKTERVHDYGETRTFTTISDAYYLYLELYDEINAVGDYFVDFCFGHPNVYSRYIEDIMYIDLRLPYLFDELNKAYENGTLDDDLAEEIRSELEDLRNRIDYLSATLLSEELEADINFTGTLLKDAWNTIVTDYADVADDFKDEYDALVDELNKLLEEQENAYNNGTLTDELAEEIRAKLEEIKREIEELLVAAEEAHGTTGIDSIFSNLGDDVQIYTLSGIRVDTPTKENVYIIRYFDGTARKVFLK